MPSYIAHMGRTWGIGNGKWKAFCFQVASMAGSGGTLHDALVDALDQLPAACIKRLRESEMPGSVLRLTTPGRPSEMDILRYHKYLLAVTAAQPHRAPTAQELAAALEEWDDGQSNQLSKLHGRLRKD